MMSTKLTKCKEEHKAFIDARLYKLGKYTQWHFSGTVYRIDVQFYGRAR